MSAKKGRVAKVLTVPPYQKAPPVDHSDLSNVSTIDRASFLEGLQLNHGNPLHSTAIEDDLNVVEEAQVENGKAERKGIPQTLKTTAKQHGAAGKRKQIEMDAENEKEEEKKKRSRRSTVETAKGRPEKGVIAKKKKGDIEGERAELDMEMKESDASSSPQKSSEPAPTANSRKRLVGKKPAKRRSAGQKSAVRPVKNKQMKNQKKRRIESDSGKSNDPQSQDECDSGTAQRRSKKVLSSEEEVDEDTSWNPSPKKAKVSSLGRTKKSSSDASKSRKSSSGSASADREEANTDEQRKKRRHQGRTDLDVVLDAFLDFCDQYRESVESKAVKQSIDCFSNNVKEQLLEKISSYKELRVLKRENAKVGSLIRTKTQRLLDAKHELMRAERQVWLLQKEKAELKLRLADLRRGHAFLRDISELNRQYLDYRDKHLKEKETYGASSLPALLLETKHIQTAEHQLRGINNRLEKRLKNDGK